MSKTIVIFLLMAVSLQASNNDAKMGKAFSVAFQCSVLAGKLNKKEEALRLFNYGYETGKKFIKATQEGRISKEDLRKHTPMVVLWLLQGPSIDFMLGRIYEASTEYALKGVYADEISKKLNSEEMQETIIRNKFNDKNCMLIGN